MFHSKLFSSRYPEESGRWLDSLSRDGHRVSVDAVVQQAEYTYLVIAHTWKPGPIATPVHTDIASQVEEPAINIADLEEDSDGEMILGGIDA